MKKLIPLILILTLLTACSKNNNTQQVSINENKPLLNVNQKVEQAKKELKKIWLTWQKLKDEVYEQKIIYKQLANLTWDARNIYILQHKVLPQVLKKKEATKCKHTTDIDLFAKCMVRQKISLQDIEKLLPEQTRKTFEKKYYRSFYSHDSRNLLKSTSNPIALKTKKNEIFNLVQNGIITKWMCNDLPEEETKKYCKGLFQEEEK